MFPNPASNKVRFINKGNVILKSIEVINSIGQKTNITLSNDNTFNVEHLPNGIYLLRIFSENDTATKKLVVKK